MVASPIITTLVDHCPPPSNQATAQTAPANQAITPATIPVVVATMLHHAFDYRAPATPLQAGEIVMVPLGRRKTIGVHMPEWPSPTSVTADKLKTPIRSYGAPPFAYPALTADHRRFLIKLSTYYGGRWAAPLGAVIKMALPELAVFDPAFIAKQLAPALPKTLPKAAKKSKAKSKKKLIAGDSTSTVEETTAATDAATTTGAVTAIPSMNQSTDQLMGQSAASPIALVMQNGAAVSIASSPLMPPTDSTTLATTMANQHHHEIAPGAGVIALAPSSTFTTPHPFPFNEQQQAAVKRLQEKVAAKEFSTTLLEGITGSGKTAVYFAAIRACLAQHKNVLVLLPEIALKTQWQEKFHQFFDSDHSHATPNNDTMLLAEWHSHLSRKNRTHVFYQLLRNNIRVLVGARSALLLPLQNIGLIVVDEEHDSSYKQPSRVRYHARDMAVLRGMEAECAVILSTATPSLETIHNVAQKKYDRVYLGMRAVAHELPTVQLIDLKKDTLVRDEFISAPLRTAIDQTLQAGQQVLLYLNRRGFAPVTICRACGRKLECHQCDSYLTFHPRKRRYLCHRCDGYIDQRTLMNSDAKESCPHCQAVDSFISVGAGAERVEEECKQKFPQARIAIATSDSITRESQLQQLITDIRDKNIDIVIGTQLMGKGHDFPDLMLVGVIATDQLFMGEDPRAMEKAWQSLEQVIGRAGRGPSLHTARALLQTYHPTEPLLQLLLKGEREIFWQGLMTDRQHAALPPFGKLTLLTLLHEDEQLLVRMAQGMKKISAQLLATESASLKVFGPAPSPLGQLRGRYRYRFLVMAASHGQMMSFVNRWFGTASQQISNFDAIGRELDIDPQDFS